ncbi:hypothetical protein EL26_05740 [Tumebacillus flagellatus]|uniref:Type I restriction modification DNA specificity domain-containing protein n=2 Tax=Tumebacillus flagellatus TaxID=1157490 RepID=A0A074MEP8_9BACL|nr:hypothetical protein EL26_05740 [Tumebacillus flagellatus]
MKFKIRVPNIQIQEQIANILGALDEKIEINNAINRNLEDMLQALFKHWFVDFEFPNEHGKPYKSSGGEFEESELGLIPKGWRVASLNEFCMLSTKTVNPSTFPDVTFEHYSIPAFDQGGMPVFEAGSEIKSSKYVVCRDSILVSKLNPATKRIWMPFCLTDDAVCSTEFMNYVPKARELYGFFYSLLDSDAFTQFLISNATGSTNSRQRANPKATLTYKFAYGGMEMLRKFSEAVSSIHIKKSLNSIQNQSLANIRDTLLPKLMSGEIRVPIPQE